MYVCVALAIKQTNTNEQAATSQNKFNHYYGSTSQSIQCVYIVYIYIYNYTYDIPLHEPRNHNRSLANKNEIAV